MCERERYIYNERGRLGGCHCVLEMIKKQTHLENVLKVKMFLEPDPIKNSGVDSYSLLESTYQIIQETNFGFSD